MPQVFSWTDITQTTGGLPQLFCHTLFLLTHSLFQLSTQNKCFEFSSWDALELYVTHTHTHTPDHTTMFEVSMQKKNIRI